MFLTENEQKWSQIISEELQVTDKSKLAWLSKYAQVHSVHEAMQNGNMPVDGGIYATPLNTMGMGNPMMPNGLGFNQTTGAGGYGTPTQTQFGAGIGNTGADFHNPQYQVGSGDIPMSTLTMSLEIGATTIGFELVPVIVSPGPWTMLSYMDFPYAGGKMGRLNETWVDGKGPENQNKPIYIKFNADFWKQNSGSGDGAAFDKNSIDRFAEVTVESDGGTLVGKFLDFSRIDNNMIIKVVEAKKGGKDVSIADVFSSEVTVTVAGYTVTGIMRPELVTGAADHIQGFANFFEDEEGNGSDEPMTRAQNETGVGNTIGARMFTKLVQMGAYEVTGTVTRQQLQDMPLYGVDVIGQVLEAMQYEISKHINNRILDRVFKLGVTNALNQKRYQNADLNLYIAGPASAEKKLLSDFQGAKKFIGIDGQNAAESWGYVTNAIQNTAAENVTTHQRRIMSRLLAAANLIANVSRRGRANWAVTNTQVLSALQDSAAFVVAPMVNNLVQDGSESLYFAGSVAGLNLYVDPFMTWDDCRVCVGRKGDGKTPGVVFMPYILADTVQTIVEGTMAPKLLVNSRFAIVDAGFYPEQNYLTFMIDTDGVSII